jgi:hypothetical protein
MSQPPERNENRTRRNGNERRDLGREDKIERVPEGTFGGTRERLMELEEASGF